ncbi:hypothetical protein [Rathayibacter rathayi]|uniref:hypothetical protein n=1 Tax=Rathayibacter rathayi TaxID=33887 RepID=UPI000CE8B5C7|nr:hypothetical protein [Rathayibacter rathayi]PPG15004.1 hypothetical protein C5C11_03640 [Rathayibacter rathayi]
MQLFDAAAYMLCVNTTIAKTPTQINALIRGIAAAALEATGGRTSYDYVHGSERSQNGTGVILVSLDTIRDQGVLSDPIATAKAQILWLLLDPELGLVRQAAERNGRVAKYRQEMIHNRLAEILEQKVLQNPSGFYDASSDNGLNLERLVRATPKFTGGGQPVLNADGGQVMQGPSEAIAWARQVLAGSLAPTTQRIFRNDQADLNSMDETVDILARGETRNGIFSHIVNLPDSAEDSYLGTLDEEFALVLEHERGRTTGEVIDEWEQHAMGRRGVERLHADAKALHDIFVLPALCSPATGTETRALRAQVDADDTLARRAAQAFHDLITGAPRWDQRDVDNDLLALWDDYDTDTLERLLAMDAHVVDLLVRAALTLDKKPGRDRLRQPRLLIRAASGTPAWAPFATRLLDAYVAEHYEGFSDFDNRGRTAEAIAAHEQRAAAWPVLAREAMSWPGHPCGAAVTTVAGVAVWVRRIIDADVAGDLADVA